MRKANIIAGGIGIFFSAAAFFKTFTFKQFKNVPVGPEFFPRALAVALFICCLVLVIQNIIDKNNTEAAPTLSLKNKDIQRMLIGLAIIIATAFLWSILGFLIVTPFTIFGLMLLLGKRDWIKMVIISVAVTAVVFLAFRFLLGIEMPMGLLG